jgi:MFS family permease
MHTYGLNKAEAANFLLAMTMGVLLGSPLVGYLADRLGRRKPVIIVGSLIYTGIWAYILLVAGGQPRLNLLYVLFFLAGLSGISFFLTFAVAKEANHPALSGMAMGVVNTGGFLSAAVMNVTIGLILDSRWQGVVEQGAKVYPLDAYRLSFMLYLLAGLVAVFVGFSIREKGILLDINTNT